MRKFQRAVEPDAIKEHCEKWNSQWSTLCANNPSAQFSWYSVDGRKANHYILGPLKAQTQAHCSFCDGFPIGGVSNDTIEHFRPKSKSHFPELAYSWSNLYYCCSSCQSAKTDQWDERLLKPDADSYTFEKYFEYDFTTGGMRPNPLAQPIDRKRAEVTIQLYQLNTRVRQRNRLLEARKFEKGAKGMVGSDEWAYRDFVFGPQSGNGKEDASNPRK